MSKYTIKATLERGALYVEVNGKKFLKDGHRWKDEKGESAGNYRESLEDLIAAIARYEKIHARVSGRETVTPVVPVESQTMTETLPIEQ